MVGHDDKGRGFELGKLFREVAPEVVHGPAVFGGDGLVVAACAEERLALEGGHGDHVEPRLAVIVPWATCALKGRIHGGNCKQFLRDFQAKPFQTVQVPHSGVYT